MRTRFQQQLSLGVIPISEVKIRRKTRHQLAPLLVALQYVFSHKELSEEVFKILERKILQGKKRTGRLGMSLWEILVLGTSKLNLEIDYDFLHDLANSHSELRGILGVAKSDYTLGKEYHYQTVVDNVNLLDEETINEIRDVIVRASHEIIKKKEVVDSLNLEIKVDSFVVEKDVHFPTDMNLLWDSGRKCLNIIDLLRKRHFKMPQWRQLNSWYKKLRRVYRVCSEIHRKKGAKYQERLLIAAQDYLEVSGTLSIKIKALEKEGALHIMSGNGSVEEYKLLEKLSAYKKMLDKHRDLLHRRLVLGEKIPHSEKVFSIFEPLTEWLSKGKANNKVELGHNVQIATDQYHFILYHEVCFQQVDKERTIAIGKGIKNKFKGLNYELESISFDRSYYSLPAKTSLEKEYKQVILPKPGKKSQAQQNLEESDEFRAKQKKHSTIEANISQLEHHGLAKCRDKGMQGFKRYVAYGVLAYNLHRMGNLLIQIEKERQKEQGDKKITSLRQARQVFKNTG